MGWCYMLSSSQNLDKCPLLCLISLFSFWCRRIAVCIFWRPRSVKNIFIWRETSSLWCDVDRDQNWHCWKILIEKNPLSFLAWLPSSFSDIWIKVTANHWSAEVKWCPLQTPLFECMSGISSLFWFSIPSLLIFKLIFLLDAHFRYRYQSNARDCPTTASFRLHATA